MLSFAVEQGYLPSKAIAHLKRRKPDREKGKHGSDEAIRYLTPPTERVGLMGIEELRALMGHTNIQTTLCYQKVTSSRAEEVAKKALESLTRAETPSNKIINLHYYISTFLGMLFYGCRVLTVLCISKVRVDAKLGGDAH